MISMKFILITTVITNFIGRSPTYEPPRGKTNNVVFEQV